MEYSLADLLGKQYLITAHIEHKTQIVNYIKDGYDNDRPILVNNRFLHFTAHINYRSVIVDLFALYGRFNNHNKYSFFKILKPDYSNQLTTECQHDLESTLGSLSSSISIVRDLRHKEIAHYDFEFQECISFNFDNLAILNNLFESAKYILKLVGNGFTDESKRADYAFGRTQLPLLSLQQLIKSASNL